jgi:hypothetical protein
MQKDRTVSGLFIFGGITFDGLKNPAFLKASAAGNLTARCSGVGCGQLSDQKLHYGAGVFAPTL